MSLDPKTAGLVDLLKTPIPGTKDWLVNTGKSGMQGALATAKRSVPPSAGSGVYKAVRQGGTHTAGGVTSISEHELKRLGFGDLTKASGVDAVYRGFFDEFRKMATGKEIGQLLSGLAQKQGLRPSMFPSIKQVANVATRDRDRAAEIAKNIRSTIKAAPKLQAS